MGQRLRPGRACPPVPTEDPHPWLEVDVDGALEAVTSFVSRSVEEAGAESAVVGVSGGLDSATTLHVAARALGPDRVQAVFMPGPTSPSEDEQLARAAADAAGVELATVAIEPGLEGLTGELDVGLDATARGNLQARLRMCVLYAYANARQGLVLGTGNRSELLTGYFTKHGDGAADLLPIGDLYKTQARRVAEELGVPEAILERPPTAGLWEGQTDEDELGLPYAQLDVVLAGLEREAGDEAIAKEADVDTETIAEIRERVAGSQHKRATPPVAEIP